MSEHAASLPDAAARQAGTTQPGCCDSFCANSIAQHAAWPHRAAWLHEQLFAAMRAVTGGCLLAHSGTDGQQFECAMCTRAARQSRSACTCSCMRQAATATEKSCARRHAVQARTSWWYIVTAARLHSEAPGHARGAGAREPAPRATSQAGCPSLGHPPAARMSLLCQSPRP